MLISKIISETMKLLNKNHIQSKHSMENVIDSRIQTILKEHSVLLTIKASLQALIQDSESII